MIQLDEINHPLFSFKKTDDENKYTLTIKKDFTPIMAMNLAGMVYDLCRQYPDLLLDINCLAESKIITNSSVN